MKFEKHKGARLHKYFFGVSVDGLWWNYDKHEWMPFDSLGDVSASNIRRCRSLRAFKRMLRKHPTIRGRACLSSRYVGYDVYA